MVTVTGRVVTVAPLSVADQGAVEAVEAYPVNGVAGDVFHGYLARPVVPLVSRRDGRCLYALTHLIVDDLIRSSGGFLVQTDPLFDASTFRLAGHGCSPFI